MSASDSRSILSENFLERYQIISEIEGDSDSDHDDADDSHEEPEEIEGDEQFDKQFAENPKFREWVLQKKSDASVSRDVRQKSAEDAYHVAEPSRTRHIVILKCVGLVVSVSLRVIIIHHPRVPLGR